MVKKKVDPRVRGLIDAGVRSNHRSLFILVGDHGKDQVENLHKILSKTRVKVRPSVLWCYKKELGFSSHRKKRMKEIKRSQARGLYDPERDDPFELFISSTTIRWTYYKETDKILGQTFGMCVLQDFEAITPNLLARTIETVEGGGLVIILLKTVKSLKQLYSLSMDVHSRYRTEAHHEVVPRFNERFILSLCDCSGCLVLDDELNILPISSKVNHIPSYGEGLGGGDMGALEDTRSGGGGADASGVHVDPELRAIKTSLADTPHVGKLVHLTRTVDQAKAVLSFMDAVSERSLKATVSLTAGRGRGKSAAIGLCLAGAVSCGYSNIFVTAPSPENLKTVFEFLVSGLQALKYTEHMDFEVIQEHVTSENASSSTKAVVRVNIFRDGAQHRQSVQYIHPGEDNVHLRLSQAELVAIDEAAAIPLPTVRKLMGMGVWDTKGDRSTSGSGSPYLVFLSSTINGYEGTGRSLSLKLLQQLRSAQAASTAAVAMQAGQSVAGAKSKKGTRQVHEERWQKAAEVAASVGSSALGGGAAGGSAGFGSSSSGGARKLTEITLDIPIRYSVEDPVEKWLNSLLCLDIEASGASYRLVDVMPAPKDCDLYIVNRDALFSYHSLSEAMLQRVWSLYTAAHYKNSPNDLQMLSDAPAHRLFVLLGPQRSSSSSAAASAAGGAGSGSGKIKLPDVLCVVQVAFEGMISQKSVQSEMSRANKSSGDLIPWTLSQQFNDSEFATLSGARIVRIATHPDVQKMGYGSRAIDLLVSYFRGQLTIDTIDPSSGRFGGEGAPGVAVLRSSSSSNNNSSSSAEQPAASGKDTSLTTNGKSGGGADEEHRELLQSEAILPRASNALPPLLTPITERPAEVLHWIGAAFGLTAPLLNFWSRKGHKVCYLRQTSNALTGEFSCIAIRELHRQDFHPRSGAAAAAATSISSGPRVGWLDLFVQDYRRRLIHLMAYAFRKLEAPLAITLIDPDRRLTASVAAPITTAAGLSSGDTGSTGSGVGGDTAAAALSVDMSPLRANELLSVHLSDHDMQRLELYARNMVDHHMIVDTLPTLARLLFQNRLPSVRLSFLQVAILLGTGLQHRDVDSIAAELDLPVNQVLAFFNKTVRKITSHLRELVENDAVAKESANKKSNAASISRLESRLSGATEGRGEGGFAPLRESLMEDQMADEHAFSHKQRQALIMASKDLSQHSISEEADPAVMLKLQHALNQGIKQQNNAMPKMVSVPKAAASASTSAIAGGDEEEAGEDGATSASGKKDKPHKKSKKRDSTSGGSNNNSNNNNFSGGSAKKRPKQ